MSWIQIHLPMPAISVEYSRPQWSIERMTGRKAEWDREPLRPPVAPAVGVAALGRDLGRPFLSPVAEQSCEQDRPVFDLEIGGQLLQPVQADVGERRDEVEIPERRSHGLLC